VSSRRAFRLVPLQEPEPAAELAVVVGCHGFVCTFPVRHVDRLLRRDEVEVMPPRGRRGKDAGVPLPQVVLAAGEPFVAWNLGTMLDLPPVTAAWVLLRLPTPEVDRDGDPGRVPKPPRDGAPAGNPPAPHAFPGASADLRTLIPLAVRTGPCLMVQNVQASVPLPAGLFRARGAGIIGAFATSALTGKRLEAAVGVCLDPPQLWTSAELVSSRAALAAVNEDPSSWGT
jgi:hypothetical protein